MKIAVIVNQFPSVSETAIFHKVMGLKARGVEVRVVTHAPSRGTTGLADGTVLDFVAPGLLFGGKLSLPVAVAMRAGRSPAEATHLLRLAADLYGQTARALRAWLLALPFAGQAFDVVHFEQSGLGVLYLDVLPLLAPARLVVSCRGSGERVAPRFRPERENELRRLFQMVDRVHCVSHEIMKLGQGYGLPPEKGFVNHPAIDIVRFRRPHANHMPAGHPCRLLSTGRLHWAKGIEYALVAVRKLVDRGLDVHYEVIGDGDTYEQLRFSVHDLGLQGRVALRGKCPPEEVRRALERADIFLLPSLTEGISNAALEAMAMEVPVVASAVGGMSEAISDGHEGFLVPSRDPEALAKHVAFLLANPERRRVMGLAARRRVETHFNLVDQIERFLREYKTLVATGTSAFPMGTLSRGQDCNATGR